ncbi:MULTISPECIES: YbaK/EbsC family protein [Cohaesibacter]|uniref:YbaK/EbsC family protein n=1 Tax=Cohaesibacter TaxID=655352 RepID=UPI000DE9B606|nr:MULTISPECIES: YbaK/EbsC family protein [Cohaesibacter]TLP45983.1 YbaK/EbsC family protein [Cohaesibacter sp. CAU 1516]
MNQPNQHKPKKSSKDRVREAGEALGLAIEIVTMPASTRTAEEAAEACGCAVGQIVKSLIFERHDNQHLALLLIAGDNRADMDLAARVIGTSLDRADPKKVRADTGFAIGGVAPIGHLCEMEVYMDPALLTHATVWAAAGAPNSVFEVKPDALQAATKATLLA